MGTGLDSEEVPEIARVPEATIAQRIVRAEKKIRDAAIPYRVPREAELPDRLPPVLTVLYLIFNEGYAASTGTLLRTDLSREALRLARVGPSGELVTLAEQDRTRWDG